MAEKKEIRLITCGGNVVHYQTFDTSQLLMIARLLSYLVLYSDQVTCDGDYSQSISDGLEGGLRAGKL